MLTKSRTILILLGIFLAGLASGVFVGPLLHLRDRGRAPRATFMERSMERLDESVKLSPEQRPQVEALMRETSDKMAQLRRESWREGVAQLHLLNGRIEQVLTPEQRPQFEVYKQSQAERLQRRQAERDERRARREARRAASEGATPPAPPPAN